MSGFDQEMHATEQEQNAQGDVGKVGSGGVENNPDGENDQDGGPE